MERSVDYVSWCDNIAQSLAAYAEGRPDHYVNLQQFTGFYSSEFGVSSHSVMLALGDFLQYSGINIRDMTVRLSNHTRQRFSHPQQVWEEAFARTLSAEQLIVLASLNRRSEDATSAVPTIGEVEPVDIATELAMSTIDAREVLEELELMDLAASHTTISFKRFKPTYLGLCRTKRSQVAHNQDLELYRTAGESEKIDFKRHYKWKNQSSKNEFAKDVAAMANTGAVDDGVIILGIENDGSFYQATSPSDQEEHEQLLCSATDERLQQILNTRVTPSPSISTFHGEHANGNYVIVRVTSNPEDRPYKCTVNGNKVYVRTGSVTKEASQHEIDRMNDRATRFQPG